MAVAKLVAVGRLRAGPEAALFARYAERLRPRIDVVELAEGRGSPEEVKRREGEAILLNLPASSFVVALDMGGEAFGSEALAMRLADWSGRNRALCFVIGGAEGLSANALARADTRLSLGPLTWPHMLARVLLVEQLYRAQTIAGGHPYHRAGRPDRQAPDRQAPDR